MPRNLTLGLVEGTLGKMTPRAAASRFGVSVETMLDFATRNELASSDANGELVIDFGGRSLEDLQRRYLAAIPRLTSLEQARGMRADWTILRLSRDADVSQQLVDDARHLLSEKGRHPGLSNLANTLPYAKEALRPFAKAAYRRRRADEHAEKLAGLPEWRRSGLRRLSAWRDEESDLRLDRHVAELLGVSLSSLDGLYELGLLEKEAEELPDARRRARLRPEMSAAWLRRRLTVDPPAVGPNQVRHYRRARTDADVGDEPHHHSIVRAVLESLHEKDVVPNPTILSGILGGDPQQFVQQIIDFARERGLPSRWARRYVFATETPSLTEIRAAVHPDAPLYATALDREPGSASQSPDPAILRKLTAQHDIDSFTRAAVVAFEGRRLGVSIYTLERAMVALANILPAFAGLDPSDPAHADAVLGPYGLLGVNAKVDERRRLVDVAHYFVACDISQAWHARLRPEERVAAARFRLAHPNGFQTLQAQVVKRSDELAEDAADDRDDRLSAWLEDPDRSMAFIMQTAQRTFAFADSVEGTIAWADEKGAHDATPASGEVESSAHWIGEGPLFWMHRETFIDLVGDNQPIDQWVLYAVESWRSALGRLHDAGLRHRGTKESRWLNFDAMLRRPRRRRKGEEDRLPRDMTLPENRYVVTYHGVVPVVPGGPTSPPHWVGIFENQVVAHPAQLDDEGRDRQAAAIKRLGIHNLSRRIPGGLVDHDSVAKRTVALDLRKVLGETVVPIFEFAHGTALAAFSASARYDMPERSGELGQFDLEGDHWDEWVDPASGEVYGIFEQIKKMQSGATEFICSPATMQLVERLAGCHSRRFFRGGVWPLVAPSPALARRGFGRATYLISDGRMMLDHNKMAMLFYVLVGGIGVLKPHDVKHLLNALARREGVPIEVRMRWHGHRSAQTNDAYGRETASEQREFQITTARAIQARRSRLMAIASGHPADMDTLPERARLLADRELLVDLLRVLTKHARTVEAEAKRAELAEVEAAIRRSAMDADG